jgi:hypothetical protein
MPIPEIAVLYGAIRGCGGGGSGAVATRCFLRKVFFVVVTVVYYLGLA